MHTAFLFAYCRLGFVNSIPPRYYASMFPWGPQTRAYVI